MEVASAPSVQGRSQAWASKYFGVLFFFYVGRFFCESADLQVKGVGCEFNSNWIEFLCILPGSLSLGRPFVLDSGI